MRHRKPVWVVMLAMVLALLMAMSSSLIASAATKPIRISGSSPYAGCTIGGPGTNYANAEVEPYVSVNPAQSTTLIGVWQQDRWSNGGAHGLVAGYSSDGGSTWQETTLPFSQCAGSGSLPYERASDPWVSFGPDGTAYTISISFNQSNNFNAVGAATSRDGGATWGNLRTLIVDNEPSLQFFNDKESVTADPVHAGVAYAVWDRLELPNGNPDANLHTQAYRGPTFFAKTTDYGNSWSPATAIVSVPSRQQTIGNQIVVNPKTGTLYDFFDLITPPFSVTAYKVAFVKSTDGGTTWTNPQVVSSLQSVGVTDPNTGAAIRTGDIIPEPALDPTSGELYVVWQDSRFNGGKYDEVALSTSTDGAATWSSPTRVNTPTGRPAFNPTVKVNAAGTVGVTYYDFRTLAADNTTTLPTDYWFKSSSAGAANFGRDTHLAGSFNMLAAPNAGGYFVGDYEGLTTTGRTFQSVFVQATVPDSSSNPTDVFSTSI
ncbi:MAG: sialidase family protein [Ktedonobacteraceae bacterium]